MDRYWTSYVPARLCRARPVWTVVALYGPGVSWLRPRHRGGRKQTRFVPEGDGTVYKALQGGEPGCDQTEGPEGEGGPGGREQRRLERARREGAVEPLYLIVRSCNAGIAPFAASFRSLGRRLRADQKQAAVQKGVV